MSSGCDLVAIQGMRLYIRSLEIGLVGWMSRRMTPATSVSAVPPGDEETDLQRGRKKNVDPSRAGHAERLTAIGEIERILTHV